jgi:di/tricarboxylate transporter
LTEAQALALGLVAVTAGMLAWGRLPADLVALAALIAGIVVGVVPAGHAFAGFGSDVAVVMATVALVSDAIARSGALETLVRPLLRRTRGSRSQLPVLAGAAAALSTVVRSVGTLGVMIPFALQSAARRRSSPATLLLPMAYAAMVGGCVTLIGSPANIVVAAARGASGRAPFALFDFAPVGAGVAAAVLLFLWAARSLLSDRRPQGIVEAAQHSRGVTAEARVPADSPFVGRPLGELEEAAGDGAVRTVLILRERFRRIAPTPDGTVQADDLLLLSGEPDDLERLVSTAGLVLEGAADEPESAGEDAVVREGVVTTGSTLVGATVRDLALRTRHGITVLAVGRHGAPVGRRLRFLRFAVGDVLILKGLGERAAEAMETLRILPLSERPVALGARRRSWAPTMILAGATVLAVLGLVPVAVAYAGAAVLVLALGVVTADEAYRTIEWSAIVQIAALIPLADAVRTSGASALAAGEVAQLAGGVPPAVMIALVMALAIVAASVVNGALVALVMAPVAAALAALLRVNPDAFLMAVAVGATCGFLGPAGHRAATLVAAPGGYRPADYRRLGVPAALVAVAIGTPLIVLVWGLGPA